MQKRFYCAVLPEVGDVVMDGPEAHHLAKVMRLPPGETVELFDGAGLVAAAEIVTVGKREVTLTVRTAERVPPPAHSLTLAAAIPKGERFGWLIEKATELGVARFIPLRTVRGVVDPRDSKLDRLRQVMIEACKQSRRTWMMEIAPVMEFATLLSQPKPLLMADPSGQRFPEVWRSLPSSATTTIAIGPEGGWTDAELTAAREAGAHVVSLGTTILRIETAALAVATAIMIGSVRN